MILCVSCHYRQNYISYKHRPLIQSGLRSLAPIDLYSTRWNLIFQSCIWSLCCNKKLLEWRLDYMFSSPIPRLYKSYCLFYCLWLIKSCKLLKCFMSRRCNVANAEVLAVDLWLTGARTNRVLWLSHATMMRLWGRDLTAAHCGWIDEANLLISGASEAVNMSTTTEDGCGGNNFTHMFF